MRKPIDTEATRALIAKIKKGDSDNADAIEALADDTYTKQETDDRIATAISSKGLEEDNGVLYFR